MKLFIKSEKIDNLLLPALIKTGNWEAMEENNQIFGTGYISLLNVFKRA